MTDLRVIDLNQDHLVLQTKDGRKLHVPAKDLEPGHRKTIDLAKSLNLGNWSETGPAPLFVQAKLGKDSNGTETVQLLSFEIRND